MNAKSQTFSNVLCVVTNKTSREIFLGTELALSSSVLRRTLPSENRDAFLLEREPAGDPEKSRLLSDTWVPDWPITFENQHWAVSNCELRSNWYSVVYHAVLGSRSMSDRASQRVVSYESAKEMHLHRAPRILCPWGNVIKLEGWRRREFTRSSNDAAREMTDS